MKHLIAILSIVVLSSCTVDKEAHNDLKEWNLKGNVKSVTEQTYEAVDEFGEIKMKYKPDKNRIYNEFNKDGNRTKYLHYYPKDTVNAMRRFEYIYKDKVLIEDISYSLSEDSRTENKESTTKYEYNDRGNLLATTDYKSGKIFGKVIYEYDEKNRLIKKNIYGSDGKILILSRYTYEGSSDLLSHSIDEDGDTTYYLYDSRGFMIENRWKYTSVYSGTVDHTNKFKYNLNNDIVEWIDFKNETFEMTTYKYWYDDNNNWTTKLSYVNEHPFEIVKRAIEYYN